MNTYIEVRAGEDIFGMRIGAVLRDGVTALEAVKGLLPDVFDIDDARFITAEEYTRDYDYDDDDDDDET